MEESKKVIITAGILGFITGVSLVFGTFFMNHTIMTASTQEDTYVSIIFFIIGLYALYAGATLKVKP